MGDKQPILSLTLTDFKITYARGTGAGGQKRNKTESKVQILHEPSGAYAESDKTRSQHQNKIDAFSKISKDKKLLNWIKIEVAKREGKLKEIEEKVDFEMKNRTKVEIKDEHGRWINECGQE